MSVPSAQEIRKPLLEIFKDEAPHNFVINELLEIIAEKLNAELDEMSSTEKTAFKNNINDSINYLLKNKLLRHPSKTTYLISKTGSEVLADDPEFIDDAYLSKTNNNETVEEIPEPEEIEEEAVEESEEIPVGFDEDEQEPEEEPDIDEVDVQAQEEQEEPEEQEESGAIEDFPQEAEETEKLEEIEESNSELDTEVSGPESEEKADDNVEAAVNEEEEVEEIKPEGNEDLEDMNEPELDTVDEVELQNTEEDEEELENDDEDEDDEESVKSSSNSDIENILTQYNDKLADSVLEKISTLHQDNFCMLVMDLLSKMGYRVFQTARYTNEVEGSDLIQGIILENKPGMNPIYIQARKLSVSKTVGKADMQDFVDVLAEKGGQGMFITSGKFSKSAEVVANDERVMLVDGKKLASLMISNNFCVNTEKVFELKAIDLETFEEYEN